MSPDVQEWKQLKDMTAETICFNLTFEFVQGFVLQNPAWEK
jgi:hypothetical protein